MSDSAQVESETQTESKSKKRWKQNVELKEVRKQQLKDRRRLKKETKTVGFFLDSLKQTDYYFENGLRKVYSYEFSWHTTAKERWFGRTLLDVYTSEFIRAVINQSVEDLIRKGKIRVNDQIKPLDYKLKNGDRVSHIKHRHEIPVLADEIKIIHEDDEYLVVNKPCSIPIHPCGKYRYNSLSIILAKDFGYPNLRTMYRLDRLTSGLVIMGKTFQASQLIDKHIKQRTAQKTYLARVVGEFPKERIIVEKALDCASRKIGLYWVDEIKGKESKTEFERISFNGTSSVVKCFPKTGRTHQIRIHLQYLGYPIVNDPIYNLPDVWGKNNGKNGEYEYNKEELEVRFLKAHTYEAWIIKQEQQEDANSEENDEENGEKSQESLKRKSENELEMNKKLKTEEKNDESQETNNSNEKIENIDDENKNKEEVKEAENNHETSKPKYDPKREEKYEDCFECNQVYRDPVRSELTMYLHALSYKCGDIEFQTDFPKWAEDDFKE